MESPANITVPPNTTALCMGLQPSWRWFKEVLTALYVFIFVTAIIGNALIIHIVRVRPNMKTPFNYLITNMAGADILDALVTPVIQINFMYGWIFPSAPIGTILCRLHLYVAVISISASVLTLTVIALDRYQAIVHPTKKAFSLRTVKRILIGVWIISGVVFSYDIYRVQLHVKKNGQHTCILKWGFDKEMNELLDKIDMMMKLVLLYVIPLVVMAILYTVIMMFLWQRKTPGEHSNANQKNLDSRKQKVLKMLVTIVILFAVCWLPVHVNHILIAYHKSTFQCSLPYEALMVFYWVAHANASINPGLYFIFNKNFRDGLRVVLGKMRDHVEQTSGRIRDSAHRSTFRTSASRGSPVSHKTAATEVIPSPPRTGHGTATTRLVRDRPPDKDQVTSSAPPEELLITPL